MWEFIKTVSPVERYAAASKHFSSAGFDIKKTLFVVGLLVIFAVIIYFGLKKK